MPFLLRAFLIFVLLGFLPSLFIHSSAAVAVAFFCFCFCCLLLLSVVMFAVCFGFVFSVVVAVGFTVAE